MIEYVLACRAEGGERLPLWKEREQESFAGFLAAEKWATEDEIAAGLKGVSGMMFFGSADHPVLLECLGHLLGDPRGPLGDKPRHLTTRAYLKASYAVEGAERQGYRKLAADALASQLKYGVGYVSLTLDEVEAEFRRELEEGRRFQEAIAADEMTWAQAGLDLDAEFRRKYHGEGRVAPLSRFPLLRALLVAAVLGLLYSLLFALPRRRARRPLSGGRRRARAGRLLGLLLLLVGQSTVFGLGWLFVHPLATYGTLLLYVVLGFVLAFLLGRGAERWLAQSAAV